MMKQPRIGLLALLLAVLSSGCTDKAQAPYEEGLKAEADGEMEAAKAHYEAAKAADPESEYGKKATERLKAVAAKREGQPGEVASADVKAVPETEDPPASKTIETESATSMCLDLETWTKLLRDEATELGLLKGRLNKKLRLMKDDDGRKQAAHELADDADRHHKEMIAATDRAKEHGVEDGEKPVRDAVASKVEEVAILWKKMAEALRSRSTLKIVKLAMYVDEDLKPSVEDLAVKLKADCSGTPAKPSKDCLPCSSQEDFDRVMKMGSKCCPVIMCRGDAECTGGRVCCKIPGGQLCGDASRCPASERVR